MWKYLNILEGVLTILPINTGLSVFVINFIPIGIVLEKPKEEELNLSSQLEPELIEAVRRLLDDSNAQVRIASAITLYTLKQTDEKVN